MSNPKVIIEARGGVVQNIILNGLSIEVAVIDWDNTEEEDIVSYPLCEIKTDKEIDLYLSKVQQTN